MAWSWSNRVAHAPWLNNVVDRDWPGRSFSSYINAYAAAARIVIFAAVLGSVNVSDISVASGLPETFVLAVELALKQAGWEHTVLPALSPSLKVAVAEPPLLKDEVTYFLMEFCGLQVNALDLLKAMGSAL